MATGVGTGTTVTFGTSSFSAEVVSVGWGGINRESIDTSHMGTTLDKTFIPAKLVDNGEISLEMHFEGDVSPPIITNGVAETVTIDCAGAGTGYKWAASMFQTGFDWNAPLEDKMSCTATFKVSGAVTIS